MAITGANDHTDLAGLTNRNRRSFGKVKNNFSGEVRKISGGLTDKRNASENKQVLPLLFAESCSVV